MNKYTKLVLFILVLTLAAIACTLPGGIGLKSPLPFEDNFSSADSGWDRMSEDNFSTDYLDGYYVISIQTKEYMAWANPGKNFTDTHIEVEATYIGGGLDNHFGVICRAENLDNFYVLMISSDGFYAIAKRLNGDSLSVIGYDRFEYSDAILQGVATNHIQADCVGDKLSLTVNGTLLIEVQDTSFSAGDVGLMAGTFNVTDTEIAFDNFIVTSP